MYLPDCQHYDITFRKTVKIPLKNLLLIPARFSLSFLQSRKYHIHIVQPSADTFLSCPEEMKKDVFLD